MCYDTWTWTWLGEYVNKGLWLYNGYLPSKSIMSNLLQHLRLVLVSRPLGLVSVSDKEDFFSRPVKTTTVENCQCIVWFTAVIPPHSPSLQESGRGILSCGCMGEDVSQIFCSKNWLPITLTRIEHTQQNVNPAMQCLMRQLEPWPNFIGTESIKKTKLSVSAPLAQRDFCKY